MKKSYLINLLKDLFKIEDNVFDAKSPVIIFPGSIKIEIDNYMRDFINFIYEKRIDEFSANPRTDIAEVIHDNVGRYHRLQSEPSNGGINLFSSSSDDHQFFMDGKNADGTKVPIREFMEDSYDLKNKRFLNLVRFSGNDAHFWNFVQGTWNYSESFAISKINALILYSKRREA